MLLGSSATVERRGKVPAIGAPEADMQELVRLVK